MPMAKTISKNYWALPQKDCEAFEIVCHFYNLKRHLIYCFSHFFNRFRPFKHLAKMLVHHQYLLWIICHKMNLLDFISDKYEFLTLDWI